MGRTILTLAGTYIGSVYGGPIGAFVGSVIGAFIGGLIFPEEDQSSYGPRLKDLQVQGSAYGNPIKKVYGTGRIAGDLIWTAGVTEHSQTTEEGGKGGPTYSTTTYWYTATFAIGICKGPMNILSRIWADGNLIYDARGEGIVQEEGLSFTFYKGDETQVPDSTIESVEGAGQVPAHRGLCYIVFTDFPISDYGNRIPNFNFEVGESLAGTYPYDQYGIYGGGNGVIVTTQDGMYAYHFSVGYMTRVNLITQSVDIGPIDLETIVPDWMGSVPCQDIDENGNIYGIILAPLPDYEARPIKLNPSGEILATAEDGVGWGVITAARLVVSRNPSYPYLMLVMDIYGGHNSYIYHRDGFGKSAINIQTITGKDIRAKIATFDDTNGNFWVIASKTALDSDPYTYIIKLTAEGEVLDTQDITSLVGGSISPDVCFFEPISGFLYFDAGGTEHFGYIDTNDWTWHPYNHDPYFYTEGGQNRIIDHTIFVRAHKINTITGAIVDTYTLSSWISPTPWFLNPTYHLQTNSILTNWQSPHAITQYYLDRGTPQPVTLASIVRDICQQVELTEGTDFNVSELESTSVRGYVLDSRMSARRAIEPLQMGFFFDGVESDGILKFKMRGGSSVVTIDDADMSARGENEESIEPIVTTHIQELELPYQVDVEYMDIDLDYEVGSQRGRRLITSSKELRTLSLAIVLNKDEARQIAEKTIQMIWKERDRHTFQLGRKYWYLDSVDVVTLTVGSTTYIVRIIKEGLGLSGVMKVEAVKEDSSIYTNDSEGAGNEFDRPPGISWEGPTTSILMDTPAFRDDEASDSPSGFYLASTGHLAAWRGFTLFKSSDGGLSFAGIISGINEAVLGTVSGSPLPDIADPTVWDRSSSLTVSLITPGATLSSITELEVLNEGNAAVVGDEIIQFANATLNANGTYTLDTFLRGRRGTEYAIGTHSAGEHFVLLNPSNIYRYTMGTAEVGLERTYRSVSLGMTLNSASDMLFTNNGKSGMPLSPVHVKGSRDGSNNLTITWIRRTRINGAWRDLVDVDLGETSETYEIDVYNNGTVVRTIEATSETASYTAAQQTTDGLTPGDPVHVKIYQMSETFGRGFESDATI